jgi:2-oxoglutarate dehydrogenase E2 component (dihydrolipoamide succinyltransferase)
MGRRRLGLEELMTDVVMPRMGETVDEGTVNVWHKTVGDQVSEGEPLLEIGTDKVDTDIPAPASGVLAEIRVAQDETVPVGTVIAVIQ